MSAHNPEATLHGGRNAKGGRREDLGFYFRSRWEANWARYLNFLISIGDIQSWSYEPDTFVFNKIKRGSRFYTPDFKVIDKAGNIEYHEVKGWMEHTSSTKLKRMAKYYPDIKIIIIDGKTYYSATKNLHLVIANWE